MTIRRAGLSLLLLPAVLAGGCNYSYSTLAYRVDRDTAFQAAVQEAMVWHPQVDDQNYRITSEKFGMGQTEVSYECLVQTDYNPFAFRPSTRIFIRMEQVKPTQKRFTQAEQEFLLGVKSRLSAM